jgi:hypothetical protein
MKQLYVLVAVFFLYTASTNAQTRYWVGPASGSNWNNTNNWSATSVGSPGASVPNGNTFDVIFDKPSLVINVDMGNFSLNSLTVTNNVTTRLYTPATGSIMTLSSTSTVAPALKIDAGSTLEDSASTALADFVVSFGNGAQGLVNGTWSFMGVAGGTPYASFPGTAGLGNRVDVNGTIKLANDFTFFDCSVPDYLYFNNGSVYQIDRTGGNSPRATWTSSATLLLTGIKASGPNIGLPAAGQGIGNLVINCPNMTADLTLSLPNGLIINGNFQLQHTNNHYLALSSGGTGTRLYTVQGNMDINSNTNIVLAPTNDLNYILQVNGNFNQTGGNFYLRNTGSAPTLPTTLKLAGNINQTAGTFGCLNTTTSTTTELFVVELNGVSNQNISLSSNTIDNAFNQVVLRLNNTSGATLLTPLSVGKISWNSANKGNLTTAGANVLTINNTSTTDPLVVNGPSNSGYINGPVRRQTASNVAYSFPTGKGGVYRACEVIPATASASAYEAAYFNTAYSNLTVSPPLSGVSNQEYWDISRVTGSDAVIRLTLAAAVPGATGTDAVVPAHFNGSAWEKVNGTKITPGNASSGTVESVVMTSFSPFTFASAPAASLPIYLLNFTARKEGATAKLNWTITENSTPDKFEVLRSSNGSDFTVIGTVAGLERKLAYDFTDNALPAGTIYYRLRMVDIDGKAELTKIVAVMNGSKGVVITSMMPTIVTNRAKLNISSSEKVVIQLQVTDLYGRAIKQQVHTLTNGNQEIWLNLATLPTGTYQVTGYLSTGERTTTIRFIKQ